MTSTVATLLFEGIRELRAWRNELRRPTKDGSSLTLGFVPTMGALHEGHMSLVRQALKECDRVLVSIFVNPLQFGQGEDFDKYPRPFEMDMDFCRRVGVHTVFHPTAQEMYPHGQNGLTRVHPPESLISGLCGAYRPGHFEGVATVVAKLFGQVEPDRAYFGEKDYQQLAVIRKMVLDLDMGVKISGCPTFREADGLAMSSRNVYLDPAQRALSPVLYQTLCYVRDKVASGAISLREALSVGQDMLSALPGVTLQYLEACHPTTLEPLPVAEKFMVILVAAKFGDVRLIDNLIVAR